MGCGCKARREKLARLNTRVGRWLAKKMGKPVEPTTPDETEAEGAAAEQQPEPDHDAGA